MATGKESSNSSLPQQWIAAYERDRSGTVLLADPKPERRAARVLAAFILTGLGFLALPGTLLGVWNLLSIAKHKASNAASLAWIQAHGHAQLFGWVGTFILGISLYMLPKFRGRPLKRFRIAWAVWVLWTFGVAWRWWVGVSGHHWRVGLTGSTALELIAYGLFQYVLVFRGSRKSEGSSSREGPSDLGSWLGIIGFTALGLALLADLGISIVLAEIGTAPVFPPMADRTVLLIALWGFAVPVAWGYSTRFVTVTLGLEQPIHRATVWLCAGISLMIVLAISHRFLAADALVVILTGLAIWALRVFRVSVRPPKRVGVYRHYPAFIRLAYVWLATGAIMGVLADVIRSKPGLGGASRHAVTVGFIATLIFAIGPRILPAFLGGRELLSPRLMAASLWFLNVGCLLRVSTESMAYSSTGNAWRVLPVSALLELTAVILFVVNLGVTLARPVPAWIGPEGISASLPVYWYVTSFPKTRQILIRTGLRTLGYVNEPPRSLSLAEAATADGADVNQIMEQLRSFFSKHKPRRAAQD